MNIEQLSVAFTGHKRTIKALDKVSFDIKPAETVVLLGESGCGKSITSLALMRLLPKAGVYGLDSEINVDGLDILNLPENMMRQLRGRRDRNGLSRADDRIKPSNDYWRTNC